MHNIPAILSTVTNVFGAVPPVLSPIADIFTPVTPVLATVPHIFESVANNGIGSASRRR
ncbi:MAG: hypothetical protein ACT4P7_15920 [Gemmatimonadaceae bacterium]